MTETYDSTHSYTADAKEELARLREKVETLMKDHVTPAIGAAADQAEQAARATRDTLRDSAERMSETVRAQPLTAIGIAVAAGFVLAALARR